MKPHFVSVMPVAVIEVLLWFDIHVVSTCECGF